MAWRACRVYAKFAIGAIFSWTRAILIRTDKPAFLTNEALDFISRNALDSTRRMRGSANHALFIFIWINRTRIGEPMRSLRASSYEAAENLPQ